jgi:hypothetical protein
MKTIELNNMSGFPVAFYIGDELQGLVEVGTTVDVPGKHADELSVKSPWVGHPLQLSVTESRYKITFTIKDKTE